MALNQLERLAVLEEKVQTVKNDVAQVDLKVSDISTKIDAKFAMLEVNLEDKFASQDKKFASKLTEKIVYGLCAIILVGFITALVTLVIQQPRNSTTTTSQGNSTQTTTK